MRKDDKKEKEEKQKLASTVEIVGWKTGGTSEEKAWMMGSV